MEKKKQPKGMKYVYLNRSALRFKDGEYYRDAGHWWVDFKVLEDGSVISVSDLKWLDGVQLIPTTREEWVADNDGYLYN